MFFIYCHNPNLVPHFIFWKNKKKCIIIIRGILLVINLLEQVVWCLFLLVNSFRQQIFKLLIIRGIEDFPHIIYQQLHILVFWRHKERSSRVMSFYIWHVNSQEIIKLPGTDGLPQTSSILIHIIIIVDLKDRFHQVIQLSSFYLLFVSHTDPVQEIDIYTRKTTISIYCFLVWIHPWMAKKKGNNS